MKSQIIRELGSEDLLLPETINEGLEANDKSKYFLTLIQLAKNHADSPADEPDNLRKERILYKVAEAEFDDVVQNSTKHGPAYQIPHFSEICAKISDEISKMMRPLGLQDKSTQQFLDFQKRLGSIMDYIKTQGNITNETITKITSGDQSNGDTLHVLIMQLHRELNKLQREISKETIDGAKVYSIFEEDKKIIHSFMRGLNKTLALKFDHPGLDTTITRKGASLLIQNDIGTTDSHVLVISVRNLDVSITYTDVHVLRILFFQSLFEKFNLCWNDTKSLNTSFSEEQYHLCVGQYVAKSSHELEEFLEFTGSRLVFLIDWNKGRKRLQNLVKKKSAIEILRWAADNNCGHMGFLHMGGEQLVYQLTDMATKNPLKFGQRFDDVLGPQPAQEFLKFALNTIATSLLAGKSESFIKAELRAEMSNYFQTKHHLLIETLNQQAVLVFEAATTIRACLVNSYTEEAAQFLSRSVSRVKTWETEADLLLNQVRMMTKHAPEIKTIEQVMSNADDSIDSLEEATFLLQILPARTTSTELMNILHDLADCFLQGSKEYIKAIQNAKYIKNGNSRSEITDFLDSVDTIMSLEHKSDKILRDFKTALVKHNTDFKQYAILAEIASQIESASDSIMKSAIIFRDSVFEDAIR
jgi:hypothetical protein